MVEDKQYEPKDIILCRYKNESRLHQFYIVNVDGDKGEATVRFLSPIFDPKTNVIINLDDIVQIINVDIQGVKLEELEAVKNPTRLIGFIQEQKQKKESEE